MQKLAELCIRRPVFATMLIMSLLVLGIYSYFHLGVDLFPKVEFPYVVVTTTLAGASPEEIESQITQKIEESVNTINGIEDLSSISSEGVSQVVVQFVLEKNADQAAQDVRDKINSVLKDFPEGTDFPVIQKIDPDAIPVMDLAVSANRTPRDITYTADKIIKQQIESIDGVGSVDFIGDRKREIHIWVDAHKMEQYGLSVNQVKQTLGAQNVEVPGGRIDRGSKEWQLRTLGRVENPDEFNNIILSQVNGLPIRVKDIGHVEDSIEEPRSFSRLDGKQTVVLSIRKQSGTNTLDVIGRVKEAIGDIQKSLPADYSLSVSQDQSTYIKGSFDAIKEHLIIGGILAALVVLLFIRNIRSMLIAAISIPTSIISTFTLIWYMGFTLNMMTMFSLVLCVGIVIDDAIVVLENIFRFIEDKNMAPMDAAREATKDIGMAVMATTLSLIIIFLPMAFMGGIVGRFMQSFGITSAFSIAISLLVAFTLTPMLSSRFIKHSPEGDSAKESPFYKFFDVTYTACLKWSLAHRRVIGIISLLVVFSAFGLLKIIGKDFIIQEDQSQFEVSFRTPEDYSLEASINLVNEMETDLKSLPGLKHILVLIGQDDRKKVNQGALEIELVDIKDRKLKQKDIMALAREKMKKYHNIKIAVEIPDAVGGTAFRNADLMYYIKGPDISKLSQYSEELKKYLATIPGVTDIDSSLEPGKPEIRTHINRNKASDLGVKVSDIAEGLRTLVGGEVISSYKELDDRYDVRMRVGLSDRNSQESISHLYVPSSILGMVRLDQVASLDMGIGPAEINRRNRQREVLLVANIVGDQALGTVIDKVNEKVSSMNLDPGYSTGLTGRSKELGRTFQSFLMAFILSFIFMYMVLAAQFESFTHPITILLSLPLSIPFALLSLLFFHQTLNIFSLLGLFVLFGVVKKNAILQVDHANNLRRNEGMPRYDAVVLACRDRLRPILMTTFCLIAGMTPMALGTGPGSAMRQSVAFVVIGGQTLCLLLTLLITPVAYTFFDDLPDLKVWKSIAGIFIKSENQVKAIVSSMFVMVSTLFGKK